VSKAQDKKNIGKRTGRVRMSIFPLLSEVGRLDRQIADSSPRPG
jgi:hypothetical protein